MVDTALRTLRLDRLHILPTGQAWHKPRTLSDAAHRLAMCRLAFGDLPGVVIDRREVDRSGSTYTIDTVEELAREQPGAQLFLLLGQDQHLAFTTWRRWQDLLGRVTLVVAARPGGTSTDPASAAPPAVPCLPLDMPLSPISSTAIRRLAADRSPGLAALVPEAVAGYISSHSLYQQPS
ncbi:MAG: nicotinate (nicotinamide) nucleotide adenylyltransferase [Hydrogenophaga sp.]|nr:nicotinate (nicotinamide) nucleotide adenylyltransferase [Hydrogenophaga sp.]